VGVANFGREQSRFAASHALDGAGERAARSLMVADN